MKNKGVNLEKNSLRKKRKKEKKVKKRQRRRRKKKTTTKKKQPTASHPSVKGQRPQERWIGKRDREEKDNNLQPPIPL